MRLAVQIFIAGLLVTGLGVRSQVPPLIELGVMAMVIAFLVHRKDEPER